jgi:hypothetical protein
MEKSEIVELLEIICITLQTDYSDKRKARTAINRCLEEIDKAAIKLSGKSIVKRKTLLEFLVNPR